MPSAEYDRRVLDALSKLDKGMDTLTLRFDHLEEKLVNRVEKVESQGEANGLHIQALREDWHSLDKRINALEILPQQVSSNRHEIKNWQQRIVKLEVDDETDRKDEEGYRNRINSQLTKIQESVESLTKSQSDDMSKWTAQEKLIAALGSKPAYIVYGLASLGLMSKFGLI